MKDPQDEYPRRDLLRLQLSALAAAAASAVCWSRWMRNPSI